MARSITCLGIGALALALAWSGAASAQTVHHKAQHPAAAGRQITVHPGPSYLTGGTGASVGSHNEYVYETFHPLERDVVQGTFAAGRAWNSNRLPNRFTVPGSEEPLFYLPAPF